MNHIAWAIGWPLWRRHRWGLMLLIAFFLLAALASALLPPYMSATSAPAFFGPLLMAVHVAYLYLFGVFSYGFDIDVAHTRTVCFPPALMRLPVSTRALAGWPMAFGAAAVALLWITVAAFVLRPWAELLGATLPLWWPALLMMACLAWLQATLWSPFGLAGLRIILLVGLFAGLIIVAQVSAGSGVDEGKLVTLFASAAAAGWAVGLAGIGQARRGKVPNWEAVLRPFQLLARLWPNATRRLRSPAAAQFYFERRRLGLFLPLGTCLLLPFELFPLAFGRNDVIPLEHTLLGALITPPLLAGLCGTLVSGANPWVKDYYGIAVFQATLPITSAGMAWAKLRAAAWSTQVTWSLLTLGLVIALALSGNLGEVQTWWYSLVRNEGFLKAAATVLGAALLLLVLTWRRAVDSMFLGLTARKWLIQGTIFGELWAIFAMGGLAVWIYRRPSMHDMALAVLPWLLTVLVGIRLAVAARALVMLRKRHLLSIDLVARWVCGWLGLATLLLCLGLWLVPASVPHHVVVLAVLSLMPLARLTGLTLLLDWNRHGASRGRL